MRVLFVCTANVCRSPLASALLALAAHEREVPDVFAASAGFLEGGRPVHEHVAALLDQRGVDMSQKRSQKLNIETVEAADLILTMTSEHARGVVGRFPRTVDDVYTFRHFARLVRPRGHNQSTSEWLNSMSEDTRRAYLGDDATLDIPDPIGQDFAVFEGLAGELQTAVSWIMDCAFPAKVRTP